MAVSHAQGVVAAAAIFQDSRFVLRTIHSIVRNQVRQDNVPVMALTPILSLITHETRRWTNAHHPALASKLPDQQLTLIEAIRNASKWFDSSKLGIDAAIERFRSIREAHAAEFLGNTPYAWAREYETDLGIYRHAHRDILNTHAMGLLLGPDRVSGGPEFFEVGQMVYEQAATFANVDGTEPSFIDAIGAIELEDVRSWEYYGTADEAAIDRVGYTHAIACALEFLRLMKPAHEDDPAAIFKVKYVVAYHALSSLKRLIPELPEMGWPLANDERGRHLRNDLVHYTPRHDVPASHLDPARPREALVEHYALRPFVDVTRDLDAFVNDLLAEADRHLRQRTG